MGIREMIKKVQQHSGFSDKESKEALERTVEAVAARLTADEREDFASQLPTQLQDVALSVSTVDKSQKSDLVRQFIEDYGIDEGRAKKQLMSAWQTLKESISDGEIKDIKTQLPDNVTAVLH